MHEHRSSIRKWGAPGAWAILFGIFTFGIFAAGGLRAEDELKVAHILFRSKADAEKVRAAIQGKGDTREAFRAACYEHSMDAGTKPLGGLLPTPVRVGGGYDATFTQAALGLEAGQVSQPVKSEFGWHLIQVLERTERTGVVPAKATEPQDPVDQAAQIARELAAQKQAAAQRDTSDPAKPGPNDLGSREGGTAAKIERPAAAPTRNPRPRPVTGGRAIVTIESAYPPGGLRDTQRTFAPSEAVELVITLRNENSVAQRFPSPELLPLGFQVTRLSDGKPIEGDFSGLAEPESFFPEFASFEISGRVVNLDEYFKGLTASGRFRVAFVTDAFFKNLETRFPKVRDLPEYSQMRTNLQKPGAVYVDTVYRDVSPAWRARSRGSFGFSIFETPRPGETYYARIQLSDKSTVVFELSATAGGNLTALKQFVKLANEGFYDGLNFYEVRKGDYALGGCPTRDGLGVPSGTLPSNVSNDQGITHAAGTVSFVTRASLRQGPIQGGQIGSIFFVSLKDHGEWDKEHVPFGKVVEGLDAFDRITSLVRIESVAILTEAEYKGVEPATEVASGDDPADSTPAAAAAGNPEAVIRTSKGDITVTLFEDAAYHTVASFITRTQAGYFSKGPGDAKMTFFEVLEQDGKKLIAVTGSPTNDWDGGPGYVLRDEVNNHKFEPGTLFMLLQMDENGNYLANTAGSIFGICLEPVPAYDFEQKFTIFGKVTQGLDVLGKIERGDEILEVEVTQKKDRPYDRFRKA